MTDQQSSHPSQASSSVIASDIDRAVFLGNPALDHMYSALMSLGAELWALRRRQNVVEALLEKRGAVTRAAIEAYVPDAREEAAWQAERDVFVETLYAPFADRGDLTYHESLRFEAKA